MGKITFQQFLQHLRTLYSLSWKVPAEDQHFALETLMLLGKEYLPQAEATYDLSVLGFDQRTSSGFVGKLRLELLSSGQGFVRHPEMLFVYCDASFRDAFARGEKYLKQGQIWKEGAIRWHLSRDEPPLKVCNGGSMGAPLTVGANLLLLGETPDPTLSMTARLVDVDGSIGSVGYTVEKILAAATPGRGIQRVIVAADQQSVPNVPHLIIERVESVEKAVSCFQQEMAPRRCIREHVHRECNRLPMLSEKPATMDTHYVLLPLLQEVEKEDLPEGKEAGGETAKGERDLDTLRWEETRLEKQRGRSVHYERSLSTLSSRHFGRP